MPEIFNLDRLENGAAGAFERVPARLAAAGLRFEVTGRHAERHAARIAGTIPQMEAYRAAVEAPAEWVEGALVLPRTRLSGRHGLPWLPEQDRFVIGDAMNKLKEQTTFPDDPAALDMAGALRLDEAIFLGGRGGATYGHWLLDFVPQIRTALATADRLGSRAPIVVINYTPFGKRLLRFLGLFDRCVFTRRDQPVEAGGLIFPLITKLGRRYSIEVLRDSYADVLERTGEAAGAAQRQAGRRLLIARRRSPVCSNFDALARALEPRGFQVLYPEEHPYRLQFQMFHQAEVVVGEDGSAMHNAGFCRPGTPLIVFSRGDKVNWWHGPVAQSAGLQLHYLASPPDGAGGYAAPVEEILRLV